MPITRELVGGYLLSNTYNSELTIMFAIGVFSTDSISAIIFLRA